MKLFSVHDKAVNNYSGVICLPSERDAVSQFSVVCNQPDTQFCKHPSDFTLVSIGEFDPNTGVITPTSPQIIANASSLKTIASKLETLKDNATKKVAKTLTKKKGNSKK